MSHSDNEDYYMYENDSYSEHDSSDDMYRDYNPHPGVLPVTEFVHLERLVENHNYSLAIKRLCVIRVERSREPGRCLFSLKYDTVRNSYQSSSMDLSWTGWQSLIYRAENICRHEEANTTYLSRFQGCPTDRVGKILWRFDMLELGEWARIQIEVKAKLFPDTAVTLKLVGQGCQQCNFEDEVKLKINCKNVVTPKNFRRANVKYLDLVVTLKGGDSQNAEAWKTPQLFYQELSPELHNQGGVSRGTNNPSSFRFQIFNK